MFFVVETEAHGGFFVIKLNGQPFACTLDGSYESADALAYRVEQEQIGRSFPVYDKVTDTFHG